MAKRRESTKEFINPKSILHRDDPPSLTALAMAVPRVVTALDTSFIKQKQEKPDWSLYRLEIRDGNPFILRDMCDRCGKVWIPPAWRKIRSYHHDELGIVYLETGVCKSCINASLYSDKFLDGEPLTEKESRKLYFKYAEEYERSWRLVLAAAPNIVATEADWQKACRFFNGCAFCGGRIEVRAKYFPATLNGTHSPWNVLPLCGECQKLHQLGRSDVTKTVKRYRVFATQGQFNRTKTARMYLLQQMRNYKIFMDPLLPYMQRFYETKTLEGSE